VGLAGLAGRQPPAGRGRLLGPGRLGGGAG
jgi:hypothetical protein